MPTKYLEVVEPKSRFAVWAWSPVIMLRISLVTAYFGYIYASVIAFLAGVPIFTLTTPEGWTPVWAFLLGTAGVVAAVGSITDRWQRVELYATMVMSALLLAYIGGLNIRGYVEWDLDRQFVGAISFIAAILPVGRFVYLAAQSGKIKSNEPADTNPDIR